MLSVLMIAASAFAIGLPLITGVAVGAIIGWLLSDGMITLVLAVMIWARGR